MGRWHKYRERTEKLYSVWCWFIKTPHPLQSTSCVVVNLHILGRTPEDRVIPLAVSINKFPYIYGETPPPVPLVF